MLSTAPLSPPEFTTCQLTIRPTGARPPHRLHPYQNPPDLLPRRVLQSRAPIQVRRRMDRLLRDRRAQTPTRQLPRLQR